MNNIDERRYDISSVGEMYKKSLDNFAEKITDVQGNEIRSEDIELDQKVYAVFKSGTGFTRTSLRRIA